MEVREPSAKYLVRQEYKKTEMGEIPQDWRLASLLSLADGQKEQFDDGDWIEARYLTNEGVRLVQTGNIGIGRFIDKSNKKYVSEQTFSLLGCKPLNVGDILICRLAEPAGRACFFPDLQEKRVITAVDVTIFRPESVDRRYLIQIFGTRAWFLAINERCGGSTRTRISRSKR